MSGWLGELLVFIRLEGLRLLRTEETFRFYLLPALFFVPTMMLLVMLLFTAMSRSSAVALPADFPPELPLAEVLEERGLEVVDASDPGAADRSVGARVTAWFAGADADEPGLCRPPVEWLIEVEPVDGAIASKLRAAVAEAGELVIERRVVEQGFGPDAVPPVAEVHFLRLPREPVRGLGGALTLLFAAVAVILGYPLLCLAGVAERRAGVTEGLLVTPIRPSAWIVARLVTAMTVQVTVIALLMLTYWLFLPGDVGRVVSARSAGDYAMGIANMALINVLFFATGLISPTVKTAANIGGGVLLVLGLLIGAGFLLEIPPAVPLLGGVEAYSTGQGWVNSAATGALGVALVAAIAVALQRFSRLKVGGGGEG